MRIAVVWSCLMSLSCIVAAIIYATTDVPLLTREEHVVFHAALSVVFLYPLLQALLPMGVGE